MRDYNQLMTDNERRNEQQEVYRRQKEGDIQRVMAENREKAREIQKLRDELEDIKNQEEQKRDLIEVRINEYEDTLNQKIRENAEKEAENLKLKEDIAKLEARIKEMLAVES